MRYCRQFSGQTANGKCVFFLIGVRTSPVECYKAVKPMIGRIEEYGILRAPSRYRRITVRGIKSARQRGCRRTTVGLTDLALALSRREDYFIQRYEGRGSHYHDRSALWCACKWHALR